MKVVLILPVLFAVLVAAGFGNFLAVDAEHTHDVLCAWESIDDRAERTLNCAKATKAVARNVVNSSAIKVCNTVIDYDSATSTGVLKWNTALNPANGTKTAAGDIFQYDVGDCSAYQENTEEIASIVVVSVEKVTDVPGLKCGDDDDEDEFPGCAVPYGIKGDPHYTYTGQGTIYVILDKMQELIDSEIARETAISGSDLTSIKKTEIIARMKAMMIAHELGHLIGFRHPPDQGDEPMFAGCPRKRFEVPQGPNSPLQKIESIMTVPVKDDDDYVRDTDGERVHVADDDYIYIVCTSENLTAKDIEWYKNIYTPAAVSDLSVRTVTSSMDTVMMTWNATNVHVEKEFEIQRCMSFNAQGPTCTKSAGTWTKVKTVSANTSPTDRVSGAATSGRVFNSPIILRGAETGSRAKEMFRVVSRTDALTTANYEAEAATAGQTVTVVRRTATPAPTPTPTPAETGNNGGTSPPSDDGDDDEDGEGEEPATSTPNTPSDDDTTTTPTETPSPPATCYLNGAETAGGSAGDASGLCGNTLTISATPNAGYVFTGWSGACSGTGACSVKVGSTGDTTSSTRTATASFAPLATCYLNGAETAGGSAGDASGLCGNTLTIRATPNAGYVFTGWSGACSGTGACSVKVGKTGDTTTSSRTATARFALRATCYLTGAAGTGGSAGRASGPCGTTLTIRATASWPRYRFTGWSGPCSGAGACSVKVGTSSDTTSSTRTATARFTKRYCTVTVRARSGGSASGGGRVWCGTTKVNYSSRASAGWCVSHFHTTFGAAGQSIPFTLCPRTGSGSITPSVDLTITAYFVRRSSLGASGQGEDGTATPTATPAPSATATPTPTATPIPSGPSGQ